MEEKNWRKPDPARVAQLWASPVVANEHVPQMLGVSPSAWQSLKRRGDGPSLFLLGGRRLFVRVDDLRAWLDRKAQADGRPGTRPRRAKKSSDASASEAQAEK